MNFKDFLRDRIPYITVYFLSTLSAVIIMYLTFFIKGDEISINNVLYAFIVSASLLLVFLLYDYYRNRSFYKQLELISNSKEDLDYILNLGTPKSSEQELFKRILLNTYKLCGDKTVKYEEAHKQYIYFINQWVHQMKTPVSVINLLLQEAQIEDNKEIYDSITEENEKLSHGLDMMLYNARLSDFNLDFNVETLDINPVVRKVINDNKKSLIRHHLFPKIQYNDEVTVYTDRKWIYFVINQIVINAIKYSKADIGESKNISFKIYTEDSKVILSISDEGIGIPKEDLSRVFNAFFTGKNGRKTSESTGMGMYLAKRVCEELGHNITVESEEGMGATFFIEFYEGKSIFKI